MFLGSRVLAVGKDVVFMLVSGLFFVFGFYLVESKREKRYMKKYGESFLTYSLPRDRPR